MPKLPAPLAALAVHALLGCAQAELPPVPAAQPAVVTTRGTDGGGARLVALQPFVSAADYATSERFEARLRALFQDAAKAGLLDARAIVVLPEYIGTWLVTEGEDAAVFEKTVLGEALTGLALAHLPTFLWSSWTAPVEDGDAFAAFTIKAERMAFVYDDVMGRLADDFDVVLVAGSIILPNARLEGGALRVTPGAPLANVSAVFGPAGEPLGISSKVFPTADETGFLAPAAVSDIAVVDTPAGRLGVLVCADSWFPESYARLREQKAELLAVPTFHSGHDIWEAKWGGYSGQQAPADVDLRDIGVISERQAWERYSFPGRAAAAGIRGAISAPLRGALWDLGGDGEGFLVDAGGHERGPRADAPAILVVNVGPP